MIMKFAEHFTTSERHEPPGHDGMWDEETASTTICCATRRQLSEAQGPLYGRTPALCATTVTEKWMRDRIPRRWLSCRNACVAFPNSGKPFIPQARTFWSSERGIRPWSTQSAAPDAGQMLDEKEFLSPYGIARLSKFHEQHPFVLS